MAFRVCLRSGVPLLNRHRRLTRSQGEPNQSTLTWPVLRVHILSMTGDSPSDMDGVRRRRLVSFGAVGVGLVALSVVLGSINWRGSSTCRATFGICSGLENPGGGRRGSHHGFDQ